MDNKVSELNILYNKKIKVVGVTFGDNPKNINKIIKNGLYYKEFKKFKGLKDKEIIKKDISLKEYNYEELSDVLLKPYKYKNEDAIKVLINDFEDTYLEVGNIPALEVKNILPLLNSDNNIIINAYLKGGNLKKINNDNKKSYVEVENQNIGITLEVIIKEK